MYRSNDISIQSSINAIERESITHYARPSFKKQVRSRKSFNVGIRESKG